MSPQVVHRYKTNQRVGRIGAQVRQVIMDGVAELLWSKRPWQIRASDVAAHCGLNQSTFYTYFASIDQAIQACAVRVYEQHPDMLSFVSGGWGPGDLPRAQALTEAVATFWTIHRPILALTRHLSEEGEATFTEIRISPHMPFFQACARMIRDGQTAGRLSPHVEPVLGAYCVFGELETLGATLHQHGVNGFKYEQSRDTIAAHVLASLTGYPGD